MWFQSQDKQRPLFTLEVAESAPLYLYGQDFAKARQHHTWTLRTPENSTSTGIILCEVICLGNERFAVIRQLRTSDGTEIMSAPEYFYYEAGKLSDPASFKRREELEEAKRYATNKLKESGSLQSWQ